MSSSGSHDISKTHYTSFNYANINAYIAYHSVNIITLFPMLIVGPNTVMIQTRAMNKVLSYLM